MSDPQIAEFIRQIQQLQVQPDDSRRNTLAAQLSKVAAKAEGTQPPLRAALA